MQIKWLGHSSFLITSRDKIKIITDPYTAGQGLNYKPINESADIVTRSHGHPDHNNTKAIQGTPTVLTEAGTYNVRGLEIRAIPAFHDDSRGSQRGNNLLFCFRVDGMNLCHLGDLGHQLNARQISEIGQVDILFIPVGGFYTIDAKQASAVVQSLQPKIVFPMHFKTSKADYPISGVDEFLKGKNNVRQLNINELEFLKESLPKETEIIVIPSAY